MGVSISPRSGSRSRRFCYSKCRLGGLSIIFDVSKSLTILFLVKRIISVFCELTDGSLHNTLQWSCKTPACGHTLYLCGGNSLRVVLEKSMEFGRPLWDLICEEKVLFNPRLGKTAIVSVTVLLDGFDTIQETTVFLIVYFDYVCSCLAHQRRR